MDLFKRCGLVFETWELDTCASAFSVFRGSRIPFVAGWAEGDAKSDPLYGLIS
jgi:hypothetical protein